MNSGAVVVSALFCLSLITWHRAVGESVLPKDDDPELERQLKLINKRPRKTIQVEGGDIVDCIDIKKQPAFDHPLLRNHKIQEKPNAPQTRKVNSDHPSYRQSSFGLKDNLCPSGTVPIRRTSREDLVRARSLRKVYPAHSLARVVQTSNTHFASMRTVFQENVFYYGAYAHINTQNPKPNKDQSSTAQMWVQGNPNDKLNNIEAGWTVFPQLYGDDLTHFFIFWTADGYVNTGCYNVLCPGFVQVDRQAYLGAIVGNISVYGGVQYEMIVNIYQDRVTKNWWLAMGRGNVHVGYWPAALFTDLGNGASVIAWGGRASGPPNGPSPPMGSGYFRDHSFNHACFFRQISFTNASGTYKGAFDLVDVQPVVDKPSCYNLKYYGAEGGDWGNTFRFGGPGGNCGN